MKDEKHLRSVSGHLRDLLIVIIIGNLISFLFGMNLENFWERVWQNSLYSAFIGMTLWKGNQYIGWLLSKRFDVFKEPYKTLRVNLIVLFLYSVVAIIIVNYIWFVLYYDWSIQEMFSRASITMLIELIVTVIITSIFFSMGFFQAWRESAVNEERLQKESIKLQYKALKNQVNPHFLFNSLNSLSSLVYQNQDLAVKFIKQLSEVYRYVLQHKDTEMVSLGEEIDFAEKYLYLQKIRLDKGLEINISIQDIKGKYIVPIALQMMIENAIKHNEASMDNPLIIKIYNTDSFVAVENNLQPKKSIKDSGGIGLSTLKARYEFMSDRKVEVEKTDQFFRVRIPLVNNIQQ